MFDDTPEERGSSPVRDALASASAGIVLLAAAGGAWYAFAPKDSPKDAPVQVALEAPMTCEIDGLAGQTTADGKPGTRFHPATEVQAVGIYEPVMGRPSEPAPVDVCLDRPGQDVILYLGAYEPTAWHIEASPETSISGIVIHGHGANASSATFHGLHPDQEMPPFLIRPELSASHKPEGTRFRALLETAASAGQGRIAAFQGDYTAPSQGFVITGTPERDNQLSADPLAAQLASADRLPEHIREVLEARASDPRSQRGWRLTTQGAYDTRGQLVYPAPESLDISWPISDMAEDLQGGRIFGAAIGGSDAIYRIDNPSGEWSVLRQDRAFDLNGLIWDSKQERLLVVDLPFAKDELVILEIDPDTGETRDEITIADELPGLSDLYDPGNGPKPRITPLAAEGDHIVLYAKDADPFSRGAAEKDRMWLVSLKTGKVSLLAYDGSDKDAFRTEAGNPAAVSNKPEAPRRTTAHRGTGGEQSDPQRKLKRSLAPSAALRGAGERKETPDVLPRPEEDPKVEQMIRQLQATISGTQILFSSQSNYAMLTTDLARNAGILPHGAPWGEGYTLKGDAKTFTVSAQLPAEYCWYLIDTFESKSGTGSAQCSPDGIFSVTVR